MKPRASVTRGPYTTPPSPGARTPRGRAEPPRDEGPGEIDVPIACGGIHVDPGDIILGDEDGVIVIPRKDAPALLDAAQKFSAADHAKVVAAANGTADRSRVDKSLAAKKCEIIDGVYGAE